MFILLRAVFFPFGRSRRKAAVVPLLCQKTNTIGKIMGPLGTKNAALDIPTREHPALYLMKRKLEETEETGLPPCLILRDFLYFLKAYLDFLGLFSLFRGLLELSNGRFGLLKA